MKVMKRLLVAASVVALLAGVSQAADADGGYGGDSGCVGGG